MVTGVSSNDHDLRRVIKQVYFFIHLTQENKRKANTTINRSRETTTASVVFFGIIAVMATNSLENMYSINRLASYRVRKPTQAMRTLNYLTDSCSSRVIFLTYSTTYCTGNSKTKQKTVKKEREGGSYKNKKAGL